MIITKIFSIFLIIVIIILIVNLLKVEPFKSETTCTFNLTEDDLSNFKSTMVSHLETLPSQFTNPSNHVELLDTKLAEFRTLQTKIDTSLDNSTYLKTKLNDIIKYQATLASLNNTCNKQTSKNTNLVGVKSRYKHVPIYFTTNSQIGDTVKIKLKKGELAIQYTILGTEINDINFITKTDTNTTSSSTPTCDEFNLTEIENEKQYYEIINKYRYKDIINISKLYNVFYPLYLLIPTDEHIGNYSLSINGNNLSLSKIDGKHSEQFELMF